MTQTAPLHKHKTYRADYHAPDGTVLHGTATYAEAVQGFLFVEDDGFPPIYAPYGALVLGADIETFATQEEADGTLWQKWARPQYATVDREALAADLAARKAARLARQRRVHA